MTDEEEYQEYQEYLKYKNTQQAPSNTPAQSEIQTPEVDLWGRAKRNLGLHTRAAMQGAPGIVDVLTQAPRVLLSKATGQPMLPSMSQTMNTAANYMDLPKPENPAERISTGTTELVSASGSMLGAGSKVKALEPLAKNGLAQLQSAFGAGISGNTAKEMGAPWYGQLLASLTGGLFAPSVANKTANMSKSLVNKIPRLNPLSDSTIKAMVNATKVDLTGLSNAAKAQLYKDIKSASVNGGELNPQAVSRLVDFYRIGATPTKGMVTQNPVQLTKEQNAAAIAANQGDETLQGLPRIYNDNNKTFINTLNKTGANKSPSGYDTGTDIINSVKNADANKSQAVGKAYDAFRDSGGRNVQFNAKGFYDDVINKLIKDGSIDDLPVAIKNRMQSYVNGKLIVDGKPRPISFNADEIKTLDKMLSRAMKNPEYANAAGIVRESLYKVKPQQSGMPGGSFAEQGIKSRELYETARNTAKDRFIWQKSAKPIKAALDNATPDTFIEKFILSKTAGADDVKGLFEVVNKDPALHATARQYVANWLKGKALNQASDEVGKFSQSSFNKALKSIGDKKLNIIFNADEVAQLKSLGRVSSYAQVQPAGSAVNNSNSGTLVLGKFLDFLGNKASLVPIGKAAITDPLQSLSGKIQTWGYGNIPHSIRANMPPSPSMLPSATLYGGLLSDPTK